MGEEWEIDISALKNSMNGGGEKEGTNSYDKRNKAKQDSRTYKNNNFFHNGRGTQNTPKRAGGNFSQKGANEAIEVCAPYNFVSFSDKVYQYPEGKLTAHNDLKEDLFTGELRYRITAETPIMVDGGDKNFYRNADGKYAIPGSTMRGLIRNNVQILGLSSFWDDIDDYALMYRNVAAGMEKNRYSKVLGNATVPLNTGAKTKNISVLKNVKAGYIRNEGGKYSIYQTDIDRIDNSLGEMNYYPISERKIIEGYLALSDKRKFTYDFFDPDRNRNILQNHFVKFKEIPKNGRVQYQGDENDHYKPYRLPISYEVKNLRNVTAIGKPGKYSKEGYVVSSGKMRQKKIIYIIPAINETKEPIPIPEKDVNAFQIDYRKRENKLADKDGNGRSKFFNLPVPGETKPVFYIYLYGRLYFGFTPRLRLFYDNTIKQGLNASHQEGILDYSKAMFGYSDEKTKKSYKTKLSFADAILKEEGDVLEGSSEAILGEPNPTSYLEYVKPKNGKADTYNSKGFQLRGVKQYWLHKEIAPHEVAENQKKVASDLNPLKKGIHFEGKVRFQNLTKDELGLLLWSIRLEEGSKMNIGKAKSYGYGQIQIDILEAKRLDANKAYRADTLDLDPFQAIDIPEAIQAYKDTINQFLGSVKIDQMPHIKEFFAMKDGTVIPDNQKTKYMDLEGYKKQVSVGKVLPSINEIVGH